MPDIPETANLPAGTMAPTAGVYVVSHHNPPHAMPHQVWLGEPRILPARNGCSGVRFSLQRLPVGRLEDHEFFRR